MTLKDVLDALRDEPTYRTNDVGDVHSARAWPDQEMAKSIAAVRNMRSAENRIGRFHEIAGPEANYYKHYPGIPSEMSRSALAPDYGKAHSNLIRDIDALGMDADTGPFSDIHNDDAKQVLLGIAESMYKYQHPQGPMSHTSGYESPPDTEIIIRKKHQQPKEAKPSQQDEGSQSIIRQRKVNPMGGGEGGRGY